MRTTGLLLVAMLIGVSAFAQSAGAIVPSPGIDLSGNWAPAVHEDQPERGPGPELVDFLGLPITESAPHTFMGFSTGKWEGDILTVYTTHIKQGWIRRNGLPQSDKAVLTEHYMRHGTYLTHVAAINDPVYLTEPLIKTQTFRLQVQAGQNWLYPCDPVVEVDRAADDVPNYLPGENPFLHEFADKYHIPLDAALGGAETMYPEYQTKL